MRTKLEILLIAAVLTFGATGCSDKTSTVVVNAGAEDFRFPQRRKHHNRWLSNASQRKAHYKDSRNYQEKWCFTQEIS